jgi:putative membrane protein
MMWGDGYLMGWWWWIGGGLVVLLIVVVVVVLVVATTRSARAPLGMPPSGPTPRQILDERYAKGELTTEEYQERIRVLGSGG